MGNPIFDSRNPNNNSNMLSYLLRQVQMLLKKVPSDALTDAIPLPGTLPGKPVTGDIVVSGPVAIGGINGNGFISAYFNTEYPSLTLFRKDPVTENFTTLNLESDLTVVISGTSPEFRGLEGEEDYSDRVTELSYVQKSYVDAVSSQTTTQRSTLTEGEETIRSGEKDLVLIHEAGLTSSLIIFLPSFPKNNQKVTIMSVGGIGLLTLSTSGGSIVGTITSLAALSSITLIWISSQNKWYRI